jgi:hypothetical protein
MHLCLCTVSCFLDNMRSISKCLFFALSGKYGYLTSYLNYNLADFLYDIDSECLNVSFKIRCFYNFVGPSLSIYAIYV